MKKLILFLMVCVFFSTVVSWGQEATYVVIAEIYGGGGNSGSYYKNDFILLFNPTYSAVDLTGWSVQYASNTGSTWSVTNLSGSITSRSYYLIQEATGSGGTVDLPTPNVIGSIVMSATAGKVALLNTTTALSGTNPGSVNIIDLVGYGTTTTYYETAAATAPSNTRSIRRKDSDGASTYGTSKGNGYDSNNNSTDFYLSTSDFSASNSPLPVELISFTGVASENGVRLNWMTATEVNNYGFDVERAVERLHAASLQWNKIGFVRGHGNSNSPKNYSFTDANAPAGNVSYRLKQIDFDGKYEYSDVANVAVDAPFSFSVKQNYPNPFNPVTVISYQLPVSSQVILRVYDVLGKEVITLVKENQSAGKHQVNFDGKDLPSGMYIYKVQAGSSLQIKKMLLVK